MKHPDEAQIYFYQKNDMERSEAEYVREHLASCDQCRKKARQVTRLRQLLNGPADEPPPFAMPVPAAARPGFGAVFKPAFGIAAALLLVAAPFVIRQKQDSSRSLKDFIEVTYSAIYDTEYYRDNLAGKNSLVFTLNEVEK